MNDRPLNQHPTVRSVVHISNAIRALMRRLDATAGGLFGDWGTPFPVGGVRTVGEPGAYVEYIVESGTLLLIESGPCACITGKAISPPDLAGNPVSEIVGLKL